MTNDKLPLKVRTTKISGPSVDDNLGFVRVATAVPVMRVTDPAFNAAETIATIPQAQKAGAKVLVFPELGLTGYTAADLFKQKAIREGVIAALATIKKASRGFDGIIFVGTLLQVDGKLFNCAVAINRGRILGIVPKTFLPNYNEFYEKRWFAASTALQSTEVELLGEIVPIGVDLLFQCEELGDLVIGVDICEDAWAPLVPSLLATLNGATLIVNLSASNELVGKAPFRRSLVSSLSSSQLCAYVYTSSGVHESSTDVVFSGHMMIAENGSILKENERFERESVLMCAEVDLQRILQDRLGNPTFTDCQSMFAGLRSYRQVHFKVGNVGRLQSLSRYVEAHPFVPKDKATLSERCYEIINIQKAALAKRLDKMRSRSGKDPHVTIGVSGGLDSTLALIATVQTFDLLGIPRTNILGYTLPGFGTTARTKGNAHALMRDLGITAREVDIRKSCLAQMQDEGRTPFGIDLAGLDVESFAAKLVDAQENAVATGKELKDLYFENVQARMRTKILMDNGFVIGTGDVSEMAKGWCTYNADQMSMYNVNCSVPKTLVKFLVEWAANNVFDGDARATMLDIVATEISPELLPTGKDGKISQKTEDKVGPYELTDFYLYYMVRWGFTPEKIFYLARHATFNQAYSDAELLKWLHDFVVRFFDNQFKRSCVPDGPKVGSISLSPRGDWRMPSDAEATLWTAWLEQAIAKLPKVAASSSNKGSNSNGKSPMSTAQSSSLNSSTALTSVASSVYRVLLRIDVQNDFCPKGNLAVNDGDAIVPLVNRLSREGGYDEVIDSQDWHPAGHGSFASTQGVAPFSDGTLSGLFQKMWTDHCVQKSAGAEFHKDLDRSMVKKTVRKGMNTQVDSYSAFYDNGKNAAADLKAKYPFLGQSTGLAEYIVEQAHKAGATEIHVDVVGLALDYCVAYSAKDAAGENIDGKPFVVRVIVDATRAIGDVDAAVKDIEASGVKVVQSSAVLPVAV
ncbi:MAG: NAD(+) synthase [Cyanobacteria bacterium REEB67]|nr:NAD(+) synthase [Cyanobacteria bacterium REEB67]